MRLRDDGGFVLALVVLMLFAITMMGGAGYLVVSSEYRMARYASQGEEALAIARGGLHRFVAEQLGEVGDTVLYAMGGGQTVVTARRVATVDPATDVYFIRSEASIVDPLLPDVPARRVVGGYAYHRKRPVPLHATLVLSVEELEVRSGARVSGHDAGGGVCPGGTQPSIGGAIVREDFEVDGTLEGSPGSQLWPGGFAEFSTRMGLRWDVLTDPAFPVDFEDSPPSFGSLPADAFPVVRYNGNLTANPSWDGRGVLIVTGRFRPRGGFRWDGIVLAGWADGMLDADIDGMVVAGFSGTEPYPEVETRGDIRYHSCNVSRANEALSYLELIRNTVFEVR